VELWSFVATIARRWRVLVPAMVLTTVLCAAIVFTAKPNYEANGSLVVLLPSHPSDDPEDEAVNPWFTADASAGQFANLMISAVTGPQFEERVALVGVPKTFLIAPDATRPAVVNIKVTAPTEQIALEAWAKLVEAFRQEVNARQHALDAPPDTRYRAYDLTIPGETTTVRTRVKLAIGLFGLGAVGSLMLVAVLELTGAVRRIRAREAEPERHPELVPT
jgi:capsular polysaccharide biosynthesis protein